MKILRTLPHQRTTRGGTTLTEVLMAILCMGIGVVAVASLFPIALLRSVQATQLTQGTILRFNAETLVDLNPAMVFNPDGTTISNHFSTNYLVDPLGAAIISNDTGGAAGPVGNLPRWDLGVADEAAAENLVTLPDSWVTMHEEIPASNTLDSVVLQNPVPQDVLDTLAANQTLRLVMFSANGRLSETRFLTDAANQISGATITWPNEADLPANGQYFDNEITRVRIEVRERRYTWLLTVRNFTTDPAVPKALVDVVIFFRRSPSLEEETAFTLSNQDGMGNQNLPNGQYRVVGTNPYLKKGGFMLDTDSGKWHRIQKVVEGTPPVITLERNIPGLHNRQVVFMRGVIEVYPLGTKP